MLDSNGHIIHIDYGFILSIQPGKGLKIENAPFKLTEEFVELIGKRDRMRFRKFRNLMRSGFMALQEHADKIIVIVEMMMMGQEDLPCFRDKEAAVRELKERLHPMGKVMLNEKQASDFIDGLIEHSVKSWRTVIYDRF